MLVLQVLDGLLLRALPALLFGLPFYFLMGLNTAAMQVCEGCCRWMYGLVGGSVLNGGHRENSTTSH